MKPLPLEQRQRLNTEPKAIGGQLVRVPLRRKVGLIAPRLTAKQKRMTDEDLAVELYLLDQIAEATLALGKGTLENPPAVREVRGPVRYEDPQVLRIRREWLRDAEPQPQRTADANPTIETRGQSVHVRFPHLRLVLILDQQFYTRTLRGLLQTLAAVLTVKNGHVFVRYIRSGIEYPLERLVTARVEDYWAVRLKRENATGTADYRASNIIVEKTAEICADDARRASQQDKNLLDPTRKVYLGHRELLLAEPVLDENGKETDKTILDSVDISRPIQLDENVFALIGQSEDSDRARALSRLKAERPDDHRWFLGYLSRHEAAGLKERSRALSIRRWLKRRVQK